VLPTSGTYSRPYTLYPLLLRQYKLRPPRPIPVVHLHLYYSLFVNFFWSWIQQKYSLTLINNSQLMNSLKEYWGPGSLNELGLDYLTTHTSLSPIRRGFAPGFVNYKKGALDSPPQVIQFTSCLPMVSGSLRVLRILPPLKLVVLI
jgi:hypothetical protein